jgi:predicted esterase
MHEFWSTRSKTTACFAGKTANGTFQNMRILELKIEFAANAQNPRSRLFAVTQSVCPRRNPTACRRRGSASTIGGMIPGFSRTAVCFFAVALATAVAIADEPKKSAVGPPAPGPPAASIVPTEYLVLPAVGQYGRLPLQRDAIEAQLVTGTWKEPTAGTTLKTAEGKLSMWNSVKASDDGTLDTQKIRGGYAFATFDSPTERIMLLEAAGHAMVYVNGEPHTGDPYSVDWLRLPMLIKQGKNTLLFHLGADKLKGRLAAPPEKPVFIDDHDRTLPTLVAGETKPGWVWAAVPVINATRDWINDAKIECSLAGGEARPTPIAPLAPLSVRKVAFQVPSGGDESNKQPSFHIRLIGAARAGSKEPKQDANKPKPLAEADIVLKRVSPQDIHIRTFRSTIDGSVQSYAVHPATADAQPTSNKSATGLIVSLHGAGMSCEEHITQLAAKSWAHILAPQGRRPFGFDWEAWSRDDVFEALADARDHYHFDPHRVCLTGHSMGGHGAWHIGVSRPDQFAAVGPSSGWISYWSYGGGMPSVETPSNIDALMLRGFSASDTLKLLTNLTNTGVYMLHGGADQTVPVAQARFMRTRLAAFHPNFAYFEQPAADHWWGNECCDWPRMMAFFREQKTPPATEQTFIDFTTANPAVSSACNWVSIEAQQEQLEPSHVAIRQNAETRTFVGSTSNVARLAIDVSHLAANQPIDVTLDGQALNWLNASSDSHKLWFERQGGEWTSSTAPEPRLKSPARYGTFNSAFDNHAILIYGTAGNQEENTWASSKARYDAETFYYRGGGALEVLPDSRFDFNRDTDRNVVLYGNADTNSAWQQLLAASPVDVRRGHVRVGTRTETSDSLAVVTVHPRPGSNTATVGVVSGTGPAGMRLTDRIRWFVAGIVYPDLMILEPKTLTEGTAGVRAWGYFGLDWRTETGEIAWRNPSL